MRHVAAVHGAVVRPALQVLPEHGEAAKLGFQVRALVPPLHGAMDVLVHRLALLFHLIAVLVATVVVCEAQHTATQSRVT